MVNHSIEFVAIILLLGLPFFLFDIRQVIFTKSSFASNSLSEELLPSISLHSDSQELDKMIGTGIKLVYMTAPSKAVAADIARTLVTEKLAACVNIIPGVESHYIWEGKAETSEEVVMLAKTTNSEVLTKRVKSLHPYDVPCVVSMSVDGGENSFIQWVKDQCSSSIIPSAGGPVGVGIAAAGVSTSDNAVENSCNTSTDDTCNSETK